MTERKKAAGGVQPSEGAEGEYYIDQTTISATTKCKKDHSCLSGLREALCSVEYHMNQGISFVKCVAGADCNYRTSYGDSWICLCPVRNELYNKYKI